MYSDDTMTVELSLNKHYRFLDDDLIKNDILRSKQGFCSYPLLYNFPMQATHKHIQQIILIITSIKQKASKSI